MRAYDSYLKERLITTQGQTFQKLQRLQIPSIADNQPLYCTTFVWKSSLCVHSTVFRLFGAKAFPIYTNDVALFTQQQQVQLLKHLAITGFGPNIEPITFPTPSSLTPIFLSLFHQIKLRTIEGGICKRKQKVNFWESIFKNGLRWIITEVLTAQSNISIQLKYKNINST